MKRVVRWLILGPLVVGYAVAVFVCFPVLATLFWIAERDDDYTFWAACRDVWQVAIEQIMRTLRWRP